MTDWYSILFMTLNYHNRIVRMISEEAIAEHKSNALKYQHHLVADVFKLAKFSHRHYTRHQKNQMGEWQDAYNFWHTQPIVRFKVEERLEWCSQMVRSIISHCDDTMWLICFDRMHEAVEDRPRFIAAVKELFNEIHQKLYSYRAYFGFLDDELSSKLNTLIDELTKAQFVFNCIARYTCPY